jgi:hypothetical protein
MAPSRTASTARDLSAAVAVPEKAAEMRTAEEVAMAKATEEAVVAKVAVDKATTDKVATADKVAADKATVKKEAEEAMLKVAVDAAVMKTVGRGGAVAVRTSVGSVGFRSGSSPSPVMGTKRAAAPGGSTPPSKRLRSAWKLWYVEQCNTHFLQIIKFYQISSALGCISK